MRLRLFLIPGILILIFIISLQIKSEIQLKNEKKEAVTRAINFLINKNEKLREFYQISDDPDLRLRLYENIKDYESVFWQDKSINKLPPEENIDNQIL